MTPKKEEEGLPSGTVHTLIVPLDRNRSKTATFHLKEMTEEVFMSARSFLENKKHFDATKMMIKSLQVGGDNVSVLDGNFVACRSAGDLLADIMSPVEGELKKNY